MAVSAETLEQIRIKVDLVELVREHLPNLRQSGRNYKALCPFHTEKTPSFMVSPEKGIFHCFGCGVGGDIFGFLMRIENITFFEAINKLAKRAGIKIENILDREFREIDKEKKLFYQIYEEVSLFYHWYLCEAEEAKIARGYLKKRNISLEMAKKFRLGYAPLKVDTLKGALERKGYSLEELVKTRILNFSQDKNRHYDFFSGRLIFTICDSRGRAVAFGGRILPASPERGEEKEETGQFPKYLNSAETLIFSKSRILYGLNQAIKVIHSENQVIICEGYFDVLALHQAGIENVVASLGTALTQEHLEILRRYTEKVLLLFDSDLAGMVAMERSSENLGGTGKTCPSGLDDKMLDKNMLEYLGGEKVTKPLLMENISISAETGMEIMVSILPEGLDPDEIVQSKGKEYFINFLKQAKDFFEFQIERIVGKYNLSQEKERIAAAKEILPLITKIKDTLEEQGKMRYLAKRLDLDEGLLYAEARRLWTLKMKKTANRKEISSLEVGERISNSPEEELFSLLLEDNTLLSLVVDKLNPEDFLHPRHMRMAEIIFRMNEKLTPTYLLSLLGEEHSSWISRLSCQDRPYRDKKRVVLGLVSTIKRKQYEQRWQTLSEEINAMLEGKVILDQDKYKEYQELTKMLKSSTKNLNDNGELKAVHLFKE